MEGWLSGRDGGREEGALRMGISAPMILQSPGLLNESIDYPQVLFSPSCPPQMNLSVLTPTGGSFSCLDTTMEFSF